MARRREPPDFDPPGSDSSVDSGRRLLPPGSGPRPPGDASPASGPEQKAPRRAPDLGDLPETYGKDEVELLCKDPHWCFIYWEVTDGALSSAREHLGSSGEQSKLLLRVFITVALAGGREQRELRDVPLDAHFGRRYLEAPRPGSLVRAAVGLLSPEGLFSPIAHSSLVRVPPGQPSSETSAEWLSVQPARGDGRQRERIVAARPEAAHRERGLRFGMRGETRHGSAHEEDADRMWYEGPGTERPGDSALLVRKQDAPASAPAPASNEGKDPTKQRGRT